MRHSLIYLFVLFSLITACSEEDDPAKNIASVANINNIKVAFGTPFSSLSLPTEILVTYADNTTENIPVTFSDAGYNATLADTYTLEGTLNPSKQITNTGNLKASIKIVVAPLKLKTTSDDGQLKMEYFYDSLHRLDHYRIYNGVNYTEFTYTASNKVEKRVRNQSGSLYPEKYFYHSDGRLDRIEFYYGDNILGQTHTYTYLNNKISKYDNSDQSINGLKSRSFEYDATGDITKIAFDFGNPWNFTYLGDKKMLTPLKLDPANPQNQIEHPIATFSYVQMSSYNSTYEFSAYGYPTKETRVFPGDNNKQVIITYTYE